MGFAADWDESVDFLVVGSGAAGLTGAIVAHDGGARTLVVEKSKFYGGSTAISGGAVWVPDNHLMSDLNLLDSKEEALTYLETATQGTSSSERLNAYIGAAPEMVRYLEDHSRVRFEPVPEYPDYYPEAEGGKAGGRTIEPAIYDARALGKEFAHMRPLPHGFRMPFLSVQARNVRMLIAGGMPLYRFVASEAVRYYTNIEARARKLGNTRLTLGRALVARLRRSLMDREVPLWLGTSLRELVSEGGHVIGAVLERDGRPVRVRANLGVLLACGGFEHNAAMRRRHQAAPIGSDWTAGCESNTGDAIPIAERLGASCDLLQEAWWTPVIREPGEDAVWVMVIEKGLPGGIIVNSAGERFMNEAAPYNDVGKAMYAANKPGASSIPGHLIFDATFRRRYPVGSVEPSYVLPDSKLSANLRAFMSIDESLEGLARKIGVNPEGLARTVERFNDFARDGTDQDFGRGKSLQDRYYGDPRAKPNPSLGPIAEPPFYSVEVHPGDLGTKGGLRTDVSARVIGEEDDPISGLYAAGNCSASVMGCTYPGAGGTIGPAMTFAWLAALEATRGREDTDAPNRSQMEAR